MERRRTGRGNDVSEHIRSELADGVLTVTLGRADKKNAITQAMYSAMAEATERARTDEAVRVLLLRAEGDNFSAGNDIGDFLNQPPAGQDSPVFRFLRAIATFPKPLLASVCGPAVITRTEFFWPWRYFADASV